jgi:hypothetical protein
MRSWISPSDAGPRGLAVNLIVGSILALAATAATATTTETWWTVAGGHEEDVTANLDLGLEPVTGGSFLQFSGGATRQTGRSWPLRLNAQGSWQRFLEAGERRLGAAALDAEARFGLRGGWDLRPAVSGFFLEDSGRPCARLLGVGADLALVHRGARLDVEVLGGWEGRRYPRLFIFDADSIPRDHQERRLLVGPGLNWHPNTALEASARVTAAWAEAREEWYDAREVTVLGAIRWRLSPRTRLLGHGYGRQRWFPDRPEDQDGDLTLQVGLAAEWDVARTTTATVGWVRTRYRDPLDERQDLNRVSLALTCRFGGGKNLPPMRALPRPPRAGEPVSLHLLAPGARTVAVVGDFNDWDPLVHLLVAQPDGWWTIELALPAGHYQYDFWVDGVLVPPAEEAATVPDGYGGRNGLLVVQP